MERDLKTKVGSLIGKAKRITNKVSAVKLKLKDDALIKKDNI